MFSHQVGSQTLIFSKFWKLKNLASCDELMIWGGCFLILFNLNLRVHKGVSVTSIAWKINLFYLDFDHSSFFWYLRYNLVFVTLWWTSLVIPKFTKHPKGCFTRNFIAGIEPLRVSSNQSNITVENLLICMLNKSKLQYLLKLW